MNAPGGEMRKQPSGKQTQTRTARARVRIHLALLAWTTILLIALSLQGRHSPQPTVKLTSAAQPARR